MSTKEKLLAKKVDEQLSRAADNAAVTCLSATEEDSVVLIYDATTVEIAAALAAAFHRIGTTLEVFDVDSYGERPHAHIPGVIHRALCKATVSALAVTPRQGEFSARKDVLETAIKMNLRHAHMPSITTEMFSDSLQIDYNEVSRFVEKLAVLVESSDSFRLTSEGGTDIEFTFPAQPNSVKMDGLIKPGHWQNLPSGQLIIAHQNATGTYVADQSIGDWFEHKYDIRQHPVTLEFEKGCVRSLSCDNPKFERDLKLYLRSSDNAGRISELILGANLGLTHGHQGALYQGYRPGASITIGSSTAALVTWTAPTSLTVVGKKSSIYLGERKIMESDTFTSDIIED
jgi:leucyl aminopeptidase (aminopeptidase T)